MSGGWKDGPVAWLVWALKPGEARLGAVCTTEERADHYLSALQPLYPGFKLYKEEVAMDHAFGLKDGVQALVLARR